LLTRKRFSKEHTLGLLRHIKLDIASGSSIEKAVRTVSISEATYYKSNGNVGLLEKGTVAEVQGNGKRECLVEAYRSRP